MTSPGHRTMFKNRPKPVRARDDARTCTGRSFMSRSATGEKLRVPVFADVDITSTQ